VSSISSQYSVSNGVGTGYNGAPFLNYYRRTHVKLTGQIEDNTLVFWKSVSKVHEDTNYSLWIVNSLGIFKLFLTESEV
jgi:hypothetical protein